MNYQNIAKEYGACNDIDRVFSMLLELMDQERSLDRDLAIILVGRHITMYIQDTKTDDEQLELFSHEVYQKIWGHTCDVLEKLGAMNQDTLRATVRGWLDGKEIRLNG